MLIQIDRKALFTYFDDVSACVTPESLSRIADDALEQFDAKVAEIPPDLCAPFNEVASNLLAELKQAYRFVATIARDSDDLDQISELWAAMEGFCGSYAERLAKLHECHPFCVAGQFYDRVLDIKNRCKRLAELHA